MPKREHLQNKLKELGYRYTDQTKRMYVWRRGTHFVYLPRSGSIAESNVRSILRQCGCDEDQIAQFLRIANS
jgi:hypothetical protein